MEKHICWYDGQPCSCKACKGFGCPIYKAAISQ